MSLFRIGHRSPPTFDDPVSVLDSCHRKIEDRLATLERAVAALPAADALAALGDVVRHFDSAVQRHTEDEEFSVFPRLAGDEATDALLAELAAEHRTSEAIYLALRTVIHRLRADPTLAAEVADELGVHAAALVTAYREHMRREEADLFPRARALPAPQTRAIGIEMRLRRGGSET